MKRFILKLIFRLFVTAIILLGILIGLVLKPSFLYAHETEFKKYTIYHNKPINSNFLIQVDSALEIIKNSEYYDSTIKFDICLNDGSIYPSLLEVFLGKAFALGFTSNKIAICGEMHCNENYVEVNGHKWNLIQLMAHEATHCLVYNRVGFWSSNPVANHPNWKWEGYPEYISRLSSNQKNLLDHIEILNNANTEDKDTWAINLSDGTISSKEYYKFRLLNQYCFEIKKMSFANILKDTTSEQTLTNEMNKWSEEINKIKN
jgi:hypothetical protein